MLDPEAIPGKRLSPGALAGAFAVGASLAGITMQIRGGPDRSAVGSLTLIMVFAAGVIALARPRRTRALAVADVLVALALTIELFAQLAIMYVPVLVALLIGTMRSTAVQAAVAPEGTEEAEVEAPVFAEQAPLPQAG